MHRFGTQSQQNDLQNTKGSVSTAEEYMKRQ